LFFEDKRNSHTCGVQPTIAGHRWNHDRKDPTSQSCLRQFNEIWKLFKAD